MEKLPQKTCSQGFPSAIGVALNYSGERGELSSRDFGDSTSDDENKSLTQWKSFAPPLWPF